MERKRTSYILILVNKMSAVFMENEAIAKKRWEILGKMIHEAFPDEAEIDDLHMEGKRYWKFRITMEKPGQMAMLFIKVRDRVMRDWNFEYRHLFMDAIEIAKRGFNDPVPRNGVLGTVWITEKEVEYILNKDLNENYW